MITETSIPTTAAADASNRRQAERVETLSLNRVAAALQVMLATRRAARSEAHAYWYIAGRGR